MVHQYKLGGYNIVLDVCSGSVHVVDDVAYDVIAVFESGDKDVNVKAIAKKYESLGVTENDVVLEIGCGAGALTRALAKKAKTEGLTDEELAERDKLRWIYIDSVKSNLVGQLENTYIVRPDGSKTKVERKTDKK